MGAHGFVLFVSAITLSLSAVVFLWDLSQLAAATSGIVIFVAVFVAGYWFFEG